MQTTNHTIPSSNGGRKQGDRKRFEYKYGYGRTQDLHAAAPLVPVKRSGAVGLGEELCFEELLLNNHLARKTKGFIFP